MKKKYILRYIIMALMIALMIGFAYLLLVTTLPQLMGLIKAGNYRRVRWYLKHQSTTTGLLCVGIIQLLQIWTIVVSAIPFQVASGIVFNAIPSFIVCTVASVISMTLSYIAWKYLEKFLRKVMPLSEKEEGMIQNALARGGSVEFNIFLMSFIFVMPNGLIPIMASKTEITLKNFIKAITPGVSFNVLICTLAGDRILDGDWVAVAAVILISALVIGLFWKMHDKYLQKIAK